MIIENINNKIKNELIDSYIDGVYDGINTVNNKLKEKGIDYKFISISKKELKKFYLKKVKK